jgi:hypothetical protein
MVTFECIRYQMNAYHTLRTLADDPAYRNLNLRFKELARGKAELDAEPPVWDPSEVHTLERRHVEPAKTGSTLLRVVMGVVRTFNQVLSPVTPLPEPCSNELRMRMTSRNGLQSK